MLGLSCCALVIALYWAVGTANYQHVQPAVFGLFVAGLLIGVVVLCGYRDRPWLTLLYSAAIGVVNRAGRHAFNGSDVIGVTREALILVAHGGNPYNHTFQYSNPPGSPFPYFPGEIAFYAIPHIAVGQIVGADKWAGVGIVFLLAALGTVVGPGAAALVTVLYATLEPAVQRSLDGSNDTGQAFLLVLGVLLLAVGRRYQAKVPFYAGALAFAWALAFKEFAWLIYPFAVTHLRRDGAAWKEFMGVSLGTAAIVTLPFFVTAPSGFIHNVVSGLTFHRQAFGVDIWAVAQSADIPVPQTGAAPIVTVAVIPLVGTALVLRPAANLAGALFQGLLLLCVALLCARYATSSYYTCACAVAAAALVLYLGNAGMLSPLETTRAEDEVHVDRLFADNA